MGLRGYITDLALEARRCGGRASASLLAATRSRAHSSQPRAAPLYALRPLRHTEFPWEPPSPRVRTCPVNAKPSASSVAPALALVPHRSRRLETRPPCFTPSHSLHLTTHLGVPAASSAQPSLRRRSRKFTGARDLVGSWHGPNKGLQLTAGLPHTRFDEHEHDSRISTHTPRPGRS